MQLLGFIVVGTCMSVLFCGVAATSNSLLGPEPHLAGSSKQNESALPLILKFKFEKNYKFTKGCYGAHVQNLFELQSAHWIMPADCFDETSDRFSVYGYIDKQLIPTNYVEYFGHPDYNPTTKAHNIALLSVPYYLSVNNGFDYIQMPSTEDTINDQELEVYEYHNMTLDPQKALKSFKTKAINSLWCKILYPMSPIQQNRLCASGWYAKGLSKDDHGVPLIIRENDRFKMVGMANIVRPWTNKLSFPMEFLSIHPYLDWINSVITNNSHTPATTKYRRTTVPLKPTTNLLQKSKSETTLKPGVTATYATQITTNNATTTTDASKATPKPAITTKDASKTTTNLATTTDASKTTASSVNSSTKTLLTTKRPPIPNRTTKNPHTTEPPPFYGQQYSYSVTLKIFKNTTLLRICGGAQLGLEWFLTAAECLHDNEPSDIYMTYSSSMMGYRQWNLELRTLVLAIHPEYNPKTKSNNLALFKCSRCPEEYKYALPIVPWKFHGSKTYDQEPAVTSTVMEITHANKVYGFYVHPVMTKIVSKSWCKVAHFFSLEDNHICASRLPGRLPRAEIGAPLVIKGHVSGMVQLIGIGTSIERWPTWIPMPMVFTRVEPYSDWIRNLTKLS